MKTAVNMYFLKSYNLLSSQSGECMLDSNGAVSSSVEVQAQARPLYHRPIRPSRQGRLGTVVRITPTPTPAPTETTTTSEEKPAVLHNDVI